MVRSLADRTFQLRSHLQQDWEQFRAKVDREVVFQAFSLLRDQVGASIDDMRARRNCSSLTDSVEHRRRIYGSQRRPDGAGFLGLGSTELYGELARQRNQYFLKFGLILS